MLISFSVSEEALIAQSAIEILSLKPFKHSCIFCSIVSGLANAAAAEIKKVNKKKPIFLDWLFIFPLQMGLKGAAIASGLGQILVFVILISHFIRKKRR